jgi:hypothetical protein
VKAHRYERSYPKLLDEGSRQHALLLRGTVHLSHHNWSIGVAGVNSAAMVRVYKQRTSSDRTTGRLVVRNAHSATASATFANCVTVQNVCPATREANAGKGRRLREIHLSSCRSENFTVRDDRIDQTVPAVNLHLSAALNQRATVCEEEIGREKTCEKTLALRVATLRASV